MQTPNKVCICTPYTTKMCVCWGGKCSLIFFFNNFLVVLCWQIILNMVKRFDFSSLFLLTLKCKNYIDIALNYDVLQTSQLTSHFSCNFFFCWFYFNELIMLNCAVVKFDMKLVSLNFHVEKWLIDQRYEIFTYNWPEKFIINLYK